MRGNCNLLGNSPSTMLLPISLRTTAQWPAEAADPQPLAAYRRASAALPIGCGRQGTNGALHRRGTGVRAGGGAGRGGGYGFLGSHFWLDARSLEIHSGNVV